MSRKFELKKKFNENYKKREYCYAINCINNGKFYWEVCWEIGKDRLGVLEEYGTVPSYRIALKSVKKSLRRLKKDDKERYKKEWENYKVIYLYDEEWKKRQEKINDTFATVILILIFLSLFFNLSSILLKIL